MLAPDDRSMLQPQMLFRRPQFSLGEDKWQQPTQVAPPMEPPATQPLRSVLQGKAEQERGSEQNIRRLLEQLRGRSKGQY